MLEGCVASLDGRQRYRDRAVGPMDEAVAVGERLAASLLSRGADRVLAFGSFYTVGPAMEAVGLY